MYLVVYADQCRLPKVTPWVAKNNEEAVACTYSPTSQKRKLKIEKVGPFRLVDIFHQTL